MTGIHRALDAGDKVARAFAEAEQIDALSKEQNERLQDVLSGIRTGTIFTSCDLQEFRALAEDLEDAIRQGTTTWHVHDESDMSGGYQESVRSDAAEALFDLRAALRNLSDCVLNVLNRSRAERIVGELL